MSRKNWTRFTRLALAIPEYIYRGALYKLSEKRRLLINLGQRNHYSIIKSVCDSLSENSKISVYFTSTADSFEKQKIIENLFHEGVDKARFLSAEKTTWQRWDMHIDLDYVSFVLARPSIFIQMFHGNAGKLTSSGKNYSLHKRISQYDYLFCLSENHIKLLQDNNMVKNINSTKLIGFTKLDAIANGHFKRNLVLSSYGVPNEKPTILYLPSYNEVLSLNSIGIELFEKLSAIDCSVIVKLHPNSYEQTITIGNKKTTWQAYLDKLNKEEGNIFHIRDQLAARYMSSGDILITDFGSSPTEFMATGSPIVFFDTPEANSIISDRETLQALRKATIPFATADDAITAIKILIAEHSVPDEMKFAQQELLNNRFYKPGTATNRAVCEINKILWGSPMKIS